MFLIPDLTAGQCPCTAEGEFHTGKGADDEKAPESAKTLFHCLYLGFLSFSLPVRSSLAQPRCCHLQKSQILLPKEEQIGEREPAQVREVFGIKGKGSDLL